MADYEIEELGNRTPLEVANIPAITKLARFGEIGMVKTIPDSMPPGSDIANLSVMGYDPLIYHTGRSPLEAASMGVELLETDVTFRCNLVTVSGDETYENKTMIDHSSSDITTEEATQLILDIREHLQTEFFKFYPGISYRHLIVWDKGPFEFDLTPPHDILGRKITDYLPKGPCNDFILDTIKDSYELLKNHPINIERKELGLNPANSIWIWGEGKKPRLDSFERKFNLSASVISAVDLINGIGILAGLKPIKVEGATGTIHSNFTGKAKAAIEALSGDDFVYIHLEAPDECGHQGDLEGKIKSIEIIDELVVQPIIEHFEISGKPFKVMVLPDHRTPISLRTHSSEPVPYVIYDSTQARETPDNHFSEKSAEASNNYFDAGYRLLNYFLDKH